MDRKLTRRERMKAKGKPFFLMAAFTFFWVAIVVYGASHNEIGQTLAKMKDALGDILNALSIVFDSLKAA